MMQCAASVGLARRLTRMKLEEESMAHATRVAGLVEDPALKCP